MDKREKELYKKYDEIKNRTDINEIETAILLNPIITELLTINRKYNPFRTKRQAYELAKKRGIR